MIRKRTNDRSVNRRRPSSLWKNCTTLRSLKQIHATLIVRGFHSNLSDLRELVFGAAIVVPGAISYALKLFDEIPHPDVFMWNTVMRGAAQSLEPRNAVALYARMEETEVRPDKYTFPFVLKACARLGWPRMGCCLHGKVVKSGFLEGNRFVRNSLIYFHANCGELGVARRIFDGIEDCEKGDVVAWSALTAGYARRGELESARKMFDEMPEKDLVSWNVMVTAYAKRGEMGEARKLFEDVPVKDVVTWNAMIAGYVLKGSHKEALDMFGEMRRAGERPDEITMLSLVSACAELRDLEVGKMMHQSVLEWSSKDLGVLLGNALMDMYAKCGNIPLSFDVFRSMKEKDVSTWNSIIGGLAFHGFVEESIDMFREMQRLKITPNEITMVGVLVACSHAGKVEEGRQYFKLMRDEFGIEPNIRHYGCMVDLLSRAGQLEEALEFIKGMETPPNGIVWRTLLGACKLHGNIEIGRYASEMLLQMRHEESGDYVLLSNLYAWKGEWDGVEKVRKSMDDGGIRKAPARSLIGVQ
ncbi:hypothetical protein MLD38_022536 [Melastoma candidum]|uniref:Uncharacterized protein n=1 Tax=Melastoma candidum TaxID=119954 RepID=A0ACB9QJR5_9MYRT|nr:hypothetical protein MLD38_022536 [Melastoma candidum]